MADVIVLPRAEDGLESIWLHIAEDNETAADGVVRAIGEKIQRLRNFPEIGSPRRDLGPSIRMLVHRRYVVLYEYKADEDLVEVLVIVDGARDLSQLV